MRSLNLFTFKNINNSLTEHTLQIKDSTTNNESQITSNKLLTT
ncbi:hypothetical protein H1P_1060004 [Hyella patelloides LEGE 07179]|uniref:Uncharacterized protein n=1 Tax=Hyella patelloides LEGE 07179 TaxID=945734 RepID=A0A563VJB0_9CYAN|nr:hypothetical protein H1P_1060004 [Hyella patelloides LEGE 07179]